MRLTRDGALCIVLGALLATRAAAQAHRSTTVNGQVRVTDGADAPRPLRIQLQVLGSAVQETISFDGRFRFVDVEWGMYTIAIHSPGGETTLAEISVPGGDIVVELQSKLTAVTTTTGLTTTVFDYQVPSSARRQFSVARDKARENDCLSALDHLKKAVEIFRSYAEAHNAIGNCYVQINDLDHAEDAFKEAVSLTPAVYPALNLADVYLRQGRLDDADSLLTGAIRRSPAEANGYYALANLRFKQDRLQEAEELALKTHERKQHLADVHLLLGKIYSRQNKPALLQSQLERFVKEAKSGPDRDRVRKILAGH